MRARKIGSYHEIGKEKEKKSPGLTAYRFSSNAAKICQRDLGKENIATVGTEMYGMMLDNPRMRVSYSAESDFKASDVPLIKAGYF